VPNLHRSGRGAARIVIPRLSGLRCTFHSRQQAVELGLLDNTSSEVVNGKIAACSD
jgi:hypothetical protein